MTPIRSLVLLASLIVAGSALPVRAGEVPAGKPCCCEDNPCCCEDLPCVQVKTCTGGACCCCEVKAGCNCKDCCCAKGCSCTKQAAQVKVGDDSEYKDVLVQIRETRTGSLMFGLGGGAGVKGSIMIVKHNLPVAFPGGRKNFHQVKVMPRPGIVGSCPAMPFPVGLPVPPGMMVPPIPPTLPLVHFHQPLMPPMAMTPECLPVPPMITAVPPPPCFVPPPAPLMPAHFREATKPAVAKWSVHTATHDGQTFLEICQGDDCKVASDKFLLTVADKSLEFVVHDKQIHVNAPFLKACADKVSRNKNKDELVLEGNVKLAYHKDGQHAEMKASCVVVDLADGSVEMKPAKVTNEANKLFMFWTGYFQ